MADILISSIDESVIDNANIDNERAVVSEIIICMQAIDDVASTIEKNIIDCFENNRKSMVNHAITTLMECADIDVAIAKNKTIISFDDVLRKECQYIVDGLKDKIKVWKNEFNDTQKPIKNNDPKKKSIKPSKSSKNGFFVSGEFLILATKYHNNYIPLDVVRDMFDFVKSLDYFQMEPLASCFRSVKKYGKSGSYRDVTLPKIKMHHATKCIAFFKSFKLVTKEKSTGFFNAKSKSVKDLNDILAEIAS